MLVENIGITLDDYELGSQDYDHKKEIFKIVFIYFFPESAIRYVRSS